VPAAQLEQALAPGPEYLPASQLAHVAVAKDEYLPERHQEQALEPGAENVPALQRSQADRPVALANVPTSQSVQLLAVPTTPAKRPATQAWQSVEPTWLWYVPSGQLGQENPPVVDW